MSDFEKLINASDLIEWIMETYPDWCEGAVRSIVDHVEALPSAQSERKTGKWICSDDYYKTGVCSACEWDVGEAYADCKKWFKFCPNCGARMER